MIKRNIGPKAVMDPGMAGLQPQPMDDMRPPIDVAGEAMEPIQNQNQRMQLARLLSTAARTRGAKF